MPVMTLWRWRKVKPRGRGQPTVVKPQKIPSSPWNAPALPLEIVDKILREACKLPPRGTDRQVLIENSRLYASRTPGTLGPAALLHRSHLLAFTRSLTIRVIDEFTVTLPPFAEDGIPERHRECVRLPDFLSLLAHARGLRQLRLSVAWARKHVCSFEPPILDWLSSLSLPIEVLDLKYDRPFDSPWSMTLSGFGQSSKHSALPITSQASVIEWFLPPPRPDDLSKLQILELYEIPEDARAPLSLHGSNVCSLTLTRQPVSGIADLFPTLEELVIAGPFWSSPLPTLPQTLRHIRLQALSTLPDLCVLSLEEALTADKYYATLREACKTHRVEILENPIDPSLAGRVCHKHPYFAEMERFPRQNTFAEFFSC
ncbi:hypothetical protein B0F90DRAFT_1813709 [Multifurca ochricompacta]|uniref:Uncharacterized protein n=1 Tax=Multifurca ochricompacta TaxID=376703 RepID=A0AAD4MAJ9_9AGAM|nr:hypothetical protein B0F90DRAFT_1813709 [Multifurca ochricompacta]